MRDGQVKAEFVEGDVVRVSIGAGLDEIYKRMFESACREAEKSSATIECGINVVVFGCFWFEATCNLHLKELLVSIVKPPRVGSRLWTMLERRSVVEKLDVLGGVSSRSVAPEIVSNLKKAFEVRNRLAHFKGDEPAVFGPIDAEELLTRIAALPDHELILEVRDHCREHAAAILAGKSWIDKVFEEYVDAEHAREQQ
ncbi:MAG TPA: hypothetical protein VIN93_06035 [Bryobacteraceae bacterium]|jgi:hypothetical protein